MDKVTVEHKTDLSKEELVSEYKRLLQEYINRRPSGIRMQIAKALDKNKSFVSQITNPAYSIPVPARHLPTIMDICRFSAKERHSFLEAYTAAHPNYQITTEAREPEEPGAARAGHQLVLEVPDLEDKELQRRAEQMIRDFAAQVFSLLKGK